MCHLLIMYYVLFMWHQQVCFGMVLRAGCPSSNQSIYSVDCVVSLHSTSTSKVWVCLWKFIVMNPAMSLINIRSIKSAVLTQTPTYTPIPCPTPPENSGFTYKLLFSSFLYRDFRLGLETQRRLKLFLEYKEWKTE